MGKNWHAASLLNAPLLSEIPEEPLTPADVQTEKRVFNGFFSPVLYGNTYNFNDL